MKFQRRKRFIPKLKSLSLPYIFIVLEPVVTRERKDEKTIYEHFRGCWVLYVRRDRKPVLRLVKSKNDLALEVMNRVSRGKTVYVFGHNLYRIFQITGLIYQLQKRSWRVRAILDTRGDGLIVRMTKERRRLLFIDLLNYYQGQLKEIREMFVRTTDFPDQAEGPKNPLERQALERLKIAYSGIYTLLKMLAQERLSKWGFTLSGIAYNAWRYRFMERQVEVHADPEIDELEYMAYYGGRTECYRIGEIPGKAYKLDVNSLYPYIMATRKLPVRLANKYSNLTVSELAQFIKRGFLAVAEVDIETNEPLYPYIHGDQLTFPIGRFKTALCTPELALAIERGHIRKVHRCAIYFGGVLFSQYVNYFYSKKQEAKEGGLTPKYYFFKDMLNSLYGKFAQRRREKVYEFEDDIVRFERRQGILNHEVVDEIQLGKQVIGVQKKKDPHPNAFIAISAHITSYGRVELLKLIEEAGWENTYYVDTDCLFTNEAGLKRLSYLIDPYELGKLKLEGEGSLYIITGKAYYFGDRRVIAGIPNHAKEVERQTYEYWRLVTQTKGGLSQPQAGAKWVKVKVQLKPIYTKRVVHEDGSTSPLAVGVGHAEATQG